MKKELRWYFWAMLTIFSPSLPMLGQESVQSPPSTYTDSLNNFYINQALPFHLSLQPMVNGDSTGGTALPTQKLGGQQPSMTFPKHGIYEVNFRAVNEDSQTQPVTYRIHADGHGPQTSVAFLEAPTYQQNGTTYYGAGLQVSLQASDKMSGVEQVFFQLSEGGFQQYVEPLRFSTSGRYRLQFYATDRVSNVEIPQLAAFTLDLEPPISQLDVQGTQQGNVLAPSAQLILQSEDEGAGVQEITHSFDGKAWQTYAGKPISIDHLPDGNHVCFFKAVDHVKNEEAVQQFQFYLDKIPPFANYKIIGKQYRGNQLYLAPSVRIELLSVDNRAGVDKIYYSIDGEKEREYQKPISLENSKGEHQLIIYATDKMGNTSKGSSKTIAVYFDDSPPQLAHHLEGAHFSSRDTMHIKSTTLIQLTAEDEESGLKNVSWTMDGGIAQGKGLEPISIKEEGLHYLQVNAVDQVGNKTSDSMVFYVDNSPPTLDYTLSTQDLGTQAVGENIYTVIAADCKIYLSATDQKTGVDQIYYTLNGGKEQQYTTPLQGFERGEALVITIKATDQLGNALLETVKLLVKK